MRLYWRIHGLKVPMLLNRNVHTFACVCPSEQHTSTPLTPQPFLSSFGTNARRSDFGSKFLVTWPWDRSERFGKMRGQDELRTFMQCLMMPPSPTSYLGWQLSRVPLNDSDMSVTAHLRAKPLSKACKREAPRAHVRCGIGVVTCTFFFDFH